MSLYFISTNATGNDIVEQLFRGKLAEAGRIVIPAAIRERLGLKVGTEVIISVDEEGIRLRPLDLAVEQAQKLFFIASSI